MTRFIEVTANDSSKTKLLVNTAHIVSIQPIVFEGVSRIMVPGYEELAQKLNPN